MERLIYFIGLIIVGVTIGCLYTAPYGFLVIGGGLIIFPAFSLGIYPLIKKLSR